MKYLSITQTAERWGISTRRIQILCAEGRVPGAIRIGTVWGIPDDEPKPADARIKSGKYIAPSKQSLCRIPRERWSFQGLSDHGLPMVFYGTSGVYENRG